MGGKLEAWAAGWGTGACLAGGLRTCEGIGRTRRNVVVDVVVDVDLDPSQALEVARTGRADRTAETAVRNVGGQRVAGGVHDQVHDYVHVHVYVQVQVHVQVDTRRCGVADRYSVMPWREARRA